MSKKVGSIFVEIGADASKFESALSKTKKGMGETASPLSKLKSGFEGLTGVSMTAAGGIALAGAAISATVKFLGDAEKAAVASNVETAKMEAILRATGMAANTTSDELLDMADSLSKLTGVDDEAIVSAESMMLTFRNIGRDEFPRAMQAALDLSTTFGGLEESVKQTGMAANDFSGYTKLQRAGVTFSEEQKKQIENFKKTNDLAGYQNLIFAEIEKQVGGTAAAMEKAGDGSNKLKVSYGNLQEAMGQRLIPSQRKWNEFLAKTFDEIADNIDAANDYSDAQDAVAKKLGLTREQVLYASGAVGQYGDMIREQIKIEERVAKVTEANDKILRDMGYTLEDGIWVLEGHADALKADEDALLAQAEAATKANENLLTQVAKWSDLEQGFTDKLDGLYAQRTDLENEYADLKAQGYQDTSEQIDGVVSKMGEIDKAIEKTRQEHEKQTNAMILDYMRQIMSVDELTIEETQALIDQGVAWGIYSETAQKAFEDAMRKAQQFTDALNAVPTDIDIAFHLTTTGSIPNVAGGGGGGGIPAWKEASGGIHSGYTWVGERGPELLNLPAGSHVYNNSQSMDMVDNNTGTNNNIDTQALIDAFEHAANANKIDYHKMARIMKESFMQAGQ